MNDVIEQTAELAVVDETSLDCLFNLEGIFNARRYAMAIRVRCRPRAGAPPPSLGALFEHFSQVLPFDAVPVLLALDAEHIDESILAHKPGAPVWLEIPAQMLATETGRALLEKMSRARYKLVLRGVPEDTQLAHFISAFSLSLQEPDPDGLLPMVRPANNVPGSKNWKSLRRIPFGQSQALKIADIERNYNRGSIACVGWPYEDLRSRAVRSNAVPDFSTISELIMQLDRGADVSELEAIIRRDAALSFRLLRLANSAAFGLRSEVDSFRQVVMLLGYLRLKRWLAMLLTNSSRDLNSRPMMYTSFRRGLLLEQLSAYQSSYAHTDDFFLLGVFSLIDKLFGESFATLFTSLRVPQDVHNALAERRGPLFCWLQLVEAIDSGDETLQMKSLELSGISLGQCNAAILKSLAIPDSTRSV